MRQRTRATPIQRQTSPLSIGVQLQRLPARAAAGAVPTGDSGDSGGLIMTLTVALVSPPQQGATCSYLVEIINLTPGLSGAFSATWDDMTDPSGPNGQFFGSSNSSAFFSALDPMTGLRFYATLSDGTVLESGLGGECVAP